MVATPAAMLTATGCAALFLVFGARTWLRHRTVVEADDMKVVVRGLWTSELAWSDMQEVKLNYYSTKRDRSQGWMQLALRGPGGRLRFDSTLDGFPEVARTPLVPATTTLRPASGKISVSSIRMCGR